MAIAEAPTEQQEKELVVSMSFTAPLSLTQRMQDYMRDQKLGRSAVIVKALDRLFEDEAARAESEPVLESAVA